MNTFTQPLSTTILHIRSKDAEQISELNSAFTVNLIQPLNSASNQEIHISLISAELPNSMYNISESIRNNTFVYTLPNQSPTVFVFPTQNYTIAELLRVLNTINSSLSFTHNKFTNKITISNTLGEDILLNFTQSKCRKVLGFRSLDLACGDTSVQSQGMADLATIHSIFVKSNLAAGNVLSTRAGNSTTLQKISIDVDTYGIIYLNTSDYITVNITQKNVIDHISFRLTDQNDNLLDFNDINFEFTLMFQTYPIRVQPSLRRTLEQEDPEPPLPPLGLLGNTFQTIDPVIQNVDVKRPVKISGNVRVEPTEPPNEPQPSLSHVAERTVLDHIIDNLE